MGHSWLLVYAYVSLKTLFLTSLIILISICMSTTHLPYTAIHKYIEERMYVRLASEVETGSDMSLGGFYVC